MDGIEYKKRLSSFLATCNIVLQKAAVYQFLDMKDLKINFTTSYNLFQFSYSIHFKTWLAGTHLIATIQVFLYAKEKAGYLQDTRLRSHNRKTIYE